MENLYDFHYSATYSNQSTIATPPPPPPSTTTLVLLSGSSSSSSDAVSSKVVFPKDEDVSKLLRSKVASHPMFPQLLHSYIDCHKVGAPPEMAQVLEGIKEEHSGVCQITGFLGADPELDDFMGTFCDLLVKYQSDLSRPFNEAITFLNDMETQFHSICNGFASTNNTPQPADEVTGSSEKDATECKRINEVQELKDNLLRRYSGYITNLKHEFSKKKKTEKLPKEAKQILLAWWNIHFKWPYPTDADKVALAEWTGLDQKQVNNWFINQRKRHWKPMEEMQAAILDGLYGPLQE